MRHFPLIFLAALLLTACSSERRQPPPWLRPTEKPRDENYHGGNAALLLKYDANHDGTVTRDELIRGLKAEFAVIAAESALAHSAERQVRIREMDERVVHQRSAGRRVP